MRRNSCGIIWERKSGPTSISSRVRSVSNSAEHLNRLSFESVLRHTLHRQPMVGTPHDVPVPRKVSFIFIVPSSNDIHLRFDVNAKHSADVLLYPLAERHDLIARSPSAIHQHQCLPVVYAGPSQAFSFPSALFYHPSRRYFLVVLVNGEMRQRGMFLRQCFVFRSAHHRVHEETPGMPHHLRVGQFPVTDVDDHLAQLLDRKSTRL